MKTALRAAVLVALLLAGFRVVQLLAAAEIARLYPNLSGYQEALRWDPDRADVHHRLGVTYLDRPEARSPQLARHHLARATELNPHSWPYWLDRARAEEVGGRPGLAERAYRRALAINPREAGYRWRFANFLLRQDRLDQALVQFGRAIELNPNEYLPPALGLLWKLGVDLEQIQSIWPQDAPAQLQLLGHLIERGFADYEALDRIWTRVLDASEAVEIRQADFYLRYLIGEGRLAEARRAWSLLQERQGRADPEFASGSNLIWNGRFRQPLSGGLLGWAADAGRVSVVEADGDGNPGQGSAARVVFDGSENINFRGLRQTAILDSPGRYRLSFRTRSEGITTEEGLFFEVSGGFGAVAGESVLGTTPWKEGTVEFMATAPGPVTLTLRRRPSRRIDNQLKGTLWLAQVRLQKVEEA